VDGGEHGVYPGRLHRGGREPSRDADPGALPSAQRDRNLLARPKPPSSTHTPEPRFNRLPVGVPARSLTRETFLTYKVFGKCLRGKREMGGL